jgi:hypothetical protein
MKQDQKQESREDTQLKILEVKKNISAQGAAAAVPAQGFGWKTDGERAAESP